MNVHMIKTVACPVLLIHGLMDKVVSMRQSVRLFEACRAKKMMITPKKMQHNSNLFDSPSFFTIPVVQFFGFLRLSGNPPRLPRMLFVPPPPTAPACKAGCANCHSCSIFPASPWTASKGDAPRAAPPHEIGDVA